MGTQQRQQSAQENPMNRVDIARWMLLTAQLLLSTASVLLFQKAKKCLRESRKNYKQSKDRLEYLQTRPMAIGEEIGIVAAKTVLKNTDLLERIHNDIMYLHSRVYYVSSAEPHPADCPICTSTLPELDRLIASIKTLQVGVNVGIEPAEDDK